MSHDPEDEPYMTPLGLWLDEPMSTKGAIVAWSLVAVLFGLLVILISHAS